MALPGGPPQPAYRRMGLPELLLILAISLIVFGFNRLRGGNRRGGGLPIAGPVAGGQDSHVGPADIDHEHFHDAVTVAQERPTQMTLDLLSS